MKSIEEFENRHTRNVLVWNLALSNEEIFINFEPLFSVFSFFCFFAVRKKEYKIHDGDSHQKFSSSARASFSFTRPASSRKYARK